jgi:hypothetical protein
MRKKGSLFTNKWMIKKNTVSYYWTKRANPQPFHTPIALAEMLLVLKDHLLLPLSAKEL